MLKINRRVEYALMALNYIVDKKGSKVSVREISDDLGIPFDTTSQVLQKLKRHELVSSVQGAGGGYLITDKLSKLNFLELSEIIENKKFYEDCEEKNCSYLNECNIRNPVQRLHSKVEEVFKGLKIVELLEKEKTTP